MPDNQPVDNGTLASYTVSSDLAASGQVQRVKLTQSGDGSDTHVTADANGLLVQGQVSLASSAVTASQAGSYSVIQGTSPWVVNTGGSVSVSGTSLASQAGSFNVTQGTSPWVVNTGGSVSVSGTTLASIVGSINNNPLNVLASQAGSWSVTTTPGAATQNVNVASQSLSAVTISAGNNTLNTNIASQSLSAVTVSAGNNTLNTNIASQSLSAVTISTGNNTLNTNIASQSLSGVKIDPSVTINVNEASRSASTTLNVNIASQSLSQTNVSVIGSTMFLQGPTTWKGTFKSAAGALGSHTTSAGGAGVKNYIQGFTYSYNASFISSNATTFQVKDGTVVIYEEAIANAGVASVVTGNKTVVFDSPLAGSAASPMTSTFSAVSVGTVEMISHWGYQGA